MYKVSIPAPHALGAELPKLAEVTREWTLPTPEICRNSRVTLTGPFALGFDEQGNIVPSTHIWHEGALEKARKRTNRAAALQEWPGVTVSLRNAYSDNYFHWTLENLSALVVLLSLEIDRVVIPASSPAPILESLERIGYHGLVVRWNGEPVLCHELLSFGPVRAHGHTYKPALNLLKFEMQIPYGDGPKRIYISREDARERHVINEVELCAFLQSRGFTVVRLKGMSYVEQMELFSRAEVIIGPTGAGLTNMVWAGHCKIVELFGAYVNPCFCLLSFALGYEYSYLACEPREKDMFIPPESFERLVM